jgi:hypothetical protein
MALVKGGRNRIGERLWISRRDSPPVRVTVSGTDFLAMPEAARA